ncbi:bifunctional folylpolyglutamate synthase/dihydrofolate synthase [Qipengyuania nanhaisediminis]
MGRSDDPRVQAQLDRLSSLSIQRDTLGLDTVRELLRRLGDPQDRLAPTFHVAGTNGKGSTCAFLRAMLEAAGHRVHVTTSPHLVRYNERFRVAGTLIDDARLADLLEEVFDAATGLGCSFFEITIAAAFTEFARVPADACVVEVGLGGRLDATNVLDADVLISCGIAALGIDHERFLLAPESSVPDDPMARIAFEKAGIAKSGVPLVTLNYGAGETLEIERAALRAGTALKMHGREWHASLDDAGLHYRDFAGVLDLPHPSLPGLHQAANAGLAVAMLRHQERVAAAPADLARGLREAVWPARLQRLSPGPLAGERAVFLDGGHNRSAGLALAEAIEGEHHLVIGMLDNKDPRALIEPLADRTRSIQVVPVPGHDAHRAEVFGSSAIARVDLADAFAHLPADDAPVLVTGSLYLAGEALRLNREIPD